MEDISSFRGAAGEVVRTFLRFGTFLTAIPVIFFWIVFAIVMYFIGSKIPGFLHFFLIMAAASVLIGRFALPASRGELDTGFFNPHLERGETLSFALRYVTYTILWVIPVMLLAYYVLDSKSLFYLFMYGGMNFVSGGFHGLILCFIMLICIFAPTLCCILATYTETVSEVLSIEPLRWLYEDRRDDLGAFYACLIGGMFVFWAKYIIPLLIFAILAFKSSSNFGATVATFIYILPFIVSPVLIGRLSGAFIAGEVSIEDSFDASSAPVSMLASKDPSIARAAAHNLAQTSGHANSEKSKKSYTETVSNLNEYSPSQINELIRKAEHSEQNLFTLLELSYLYKKTERLNDAIKNAGNGLQMTLNQGMGFEAVQLFKYFAKERSQLKLTLQNLQQLAPHLVNHHYFMDAAWCYLTIIASSTDDEKLSMQKKLFSVAEAASVAGNAQVAFNLYNLFSENYPDSTLVDFARNAATEEQKKIDKSKKQ
jgi:hypothetical protein